jgi:excisionase family DNA binding protein
LSKRFALEIVARLVAALEKRQDGCVGSWLTVEEAADYLRTTPDALRRAAHRKQLPSHQPLGAGSRYLFNRSELDQWAAAG